MRYLPYLLIALVLLALAWAALHDIVKGEPDPTLEWIALIVCGILFGVTLRILLRQKRKWCDT